MPRSGRCTRPARSSEARRLRRVGRRTSAPDRSCRALHSPNRAGFRRRSVAERHGSRESRARERIAHGHAQDEQRQICAVRSDERERTHGQRTSDVKARRVRPVSRRGRRRRARHRRRSRRTSRRSAKAPWMRGTSPRTGLPGHRSAPTVPALVVSSMLLPVPSRLRRYAAGCLHAGLCLGSSMTSTRRRLGTGRPRPADTCGTRGTVIAEAFRRGPSTSTMIRARLCGEHRRRPAVPAVRGGF